MSGRKQHYIPQSLLRGFEATRTKKHEQVFVFKPGQQPYPTSTEGVAAMRHFYSELSANGQKTLDDRITDYEDLLAPLLKQLRNSSPGESVDAALAAELVVHLTIRGAFVRDVFGLGYQEMLASTSKLFSDEESVRSHLGIDRDEPLAILIEELDKTIEALRPQLPVEIPAPLMRRFALVCLREEFGTIYSQHISKFPFMFEEFAERIPSLIRKSHARVLEESLAPDSRVQALAHLHWTVLTVPEANLILPDCVAISVSGYPERGYAPYLLNSGNDEVEQILLPLGSSHLLVGRRDLSEPVALDQFNQFAATCSAEFFVSPTNTAEIAAYAEYIGNESKESILSIARAAVEALSVSADSEPSVKDSCPANIAASDSETRNATEIKFTISFIDCGDQETAEKTTSIINIVVNEFAKYMPIARIESIIFAQNYAGAIRNLDRGFDTSELLIPTEEDFGVGVAMAPLVLRNGQIRCCIVMRSWLGHALLHQDNEDSFQTALHTLGSMLARAAFVDIVDTALPGILLKPIEDHWDALLFKHLDEACSSYFCSRIAAGLFPNMGSDYCDLFLTVFEHAQVNIPKARLVYRLDGDLNAFLEIAIQAIGDVLVRTAVLIGHYDGLDLPFLDDDGRMASILKDSGLSLWINVYQRDLDTVFERRGKWHSIKELMGLNVHMERLLWQFSVFPWRSETGEVKVEIPLSVDIPELMKLAQ